MATSSITIDFPQVRNQHRRLYEASEFAIGIKRWLEEQGLRMGEDFEWAVDPDALEITITFKKDSSWASLVALKFSDK